MVRCQELCSQGCTESLKTLEKGLATCHLCFAVFLKTRPHTQPEAIQRLAQSWLTGFANLYGVPAQACQPKWCTPVYSNVVGPDPVYYEEIACTSEVVDPAGKEFPGKFKFPGGPYLADVYYASDAPGAVTVAGGGSGTCMAQHVEVVDLKLHVACIPEQVLAPSFLMSHAQLPLRETAHCDSGTSAPAALMQMGCCQDPFVPASLHGGSFMQYNCNNRSIAYGCNEDCSKCNATRSVANELDKCSGERFLRPAPACSFVLSVAGTSAGSATP